VILRAAGGLFDYVLYCLIFGKFDVNLSELFWLTMYMTIITLAKISKIEE
jgi:hypothetical protein